MGLISFMLYGMQKLEPYEDGYFDPYYDGLLYLFSLMHLSGKYQIIMPATN